MNWDSFVVFGPAGHLTKQWWKHGGTLGRFAFNKLMSVGLSCSIYCHILVHCNAVIRQLDSQSGAFHLLANCGGGWNKSSNLQQDHFPCPWSSHSLCPPANWTDHRRIGWGSHSITLLCAAQIQTFAASSCPFIFFWGLQKWVWNHFLKRLLIEVPGSVICN